MKKSLMNTMRGSVWLQAMAMLVMFPSLVMLPSAVRANPSGGVVSFGGIEMNVDEHGVPLDPAFLQIIQSTDKAIINWQDFSIGAGEHTQFVQPSQMAAVLNRVVSGNPSVLAGLLSANGKVFVVNQNGIIVTPSGVIDAAGGVVLSTLDIADGDFLNGMDDTFLGTSAAGVTNYGTIMSAGGDVVLLGNFVDNQGIIGAPDGVVALGAGGNIVVHAQGENKISIVAPGVGADTGVNNAGTITGAAAELKAHGNVYALAINNSGTIRANGSATIAGRVMLTSRSADGETGGNIENTGDISANNVDGSGGFVMIDGGPGSAVEILGGKISTNGIGDTPGGEIVIIGQTINIAQGSEVTANGSDGGSIVIGSVEDTNSVTIGGKVSANGSTGNGGTVMVLGDPTSVLRVTSTGRIEATGAVNGGMITMQGGSIIAEAGSLIDAGGQVNGGTVTIIGQDSNGVVNLNGTVNASGGSGEGGLINVTGAGDVTIGREAVMTADGATGGLVSIDSEGTTTFEGEATATGTVGKGGIANVTGQQVLVAVQATMDVSGLTGGGQINVGGGFQGKDANLRNSDSTIVGGLAKLSADAINTGNAGSVVVWSSGDTIFGGEINARALGDVGRGGFVEVSGRRSLTYNGEINATSVSGDRGTVLFDPGTINIGAATPLTIAAVNAILRANTDLIIATQGVGSDIIFDNIGQANDSNVSVQWNTDASLGIFAGGDVRFNNAVRTAGAGSINVIAGWTGFEADAILGGTGTEPLFTGGPEAAWNYYVNGAEAGSFGIGGNIYINDSGNSRFVEVGSRYGNTNVAADNVFISGGSGSWDHAQLGFRDQGTVFNVESYLRLGGAGQGESYVPSSVNNPLVAMVGVNEVNGGSASMAGYGVPTSVNGVHMFDNGGERTDTFIRYADEYAQSTSNGNWWWRRLDGKAGGSSGIGDNLPEMGAGISTELIASGGDFGQGAFGTVNADINVEARGALIMRSSTSGSYTQIGHGGFAAHGGGMSRNWNSNVTESGAGDNNDGSGADAWNSNSFTDGAGLDQYYAFNFENNQSVKNASIGRLAAVIGDINIRTGLIEDPITGILEATSGSGAVLLSAGGPGSHNFAHIGHGGVGQFGNMTGIIGVEAGGLVILKGGYNDNAFASIGHVMQGGSAPNDPRMGRGLLQDTGWTPDGKLGGGQHKQFRYFSTYANRTADNANKNDVAGTDIPVSAYSGNGTNIYDGNTSVTGKGAGVTSNLHGNIDVTSEQGGVTLEGYAEGAAGNATWRRWSQVQIGHGGEAEFVAHINARGDINVEANGGDIMVTASETSRSYAQIGHGGHGFTGGDYSSQYLQGNITVSASGSMLLRGGPNPTPPGTTVGDQNRSDIKLSYAMVGHGGYAARQMLKTGDITVNVGGDLTVTSGAWGGNFAQIGHGGYDSVGQVGGDFTRTVRIADVNGDYVDMAPLTINGTTANIIVNAGGNILMDHLDPENPNDADGGVYPMDGAFTLIGHGGTYTVRNDNVEGGNPVEFYWDKTGDVTVNAAGDLTMFSGSGANDWYTRIGHGATGRDRQNNGREATFSGDISVGVIGDLYMSANVANGYGNPVFVPAVGETTFQFQSRDNPVAIGHGTTSDSTRIWFAGDVDVTVGGDATMISGKSVSSAGGVLGGAFAQVGHGGSGSLQS